MGCDIGKIRKFLIMGLVIGMLVIAATPVTITTLASEDTCYVEFQATGNESISIGGSYNFTTIYDSQTKSCPTSTFTVTNDGTVILSSISIVYTSDTGSLTEVAGAPGADQYNISVQTAAGDQLSWAEIHTSKTIETDVATSTSEDFGIQVVMGTFTSSPGHHNVTITLTGTD